MIGRRWLLLLSFLLTLLLHGILWQIAPDLVILRHDAVSARMSDRLQVRIIEDVSTPRMTTSSINSSSLQSRPGSVRDMLDWDAVANPEDLPTRGEAEIPQLAERLRAPLNERRHDLLPSDAEMRGMDERILAITAADARRDLQIARRLVRQDSEGITNLAERPYDQGDSLDEGSLRLGFDLPSVTLLDQPLLQMNNGLPFENDVSREVRASPEAPATSPDEGASAAERRVTASMTDARREALREEAQAKATIMDDHFAMTLSVYRPAEERLGYFQVKLTPRPDINHEVLSKEVLFIIDASSSIAPQKLRNFSRGVSDALSYLRPMDRFNIQIFRDTASFFREMPVEATDENIAAAKAWISSLEPHGRTDFYEALLPAVNQPVAAGYPRMLIVLTDGRPTKGVTDGRTIINGVTADNNLQSSVFAVSGGNTVNQPLLDLLAYRNKGSAHYSPNLASIQADLTGFFATLNDPLLVSLSGDFSGAGQQDIYPRTMPDLYKGRPYEIYGRFDPELSAPFAFRVTGQAGEARREMAFRVNLDAAADGGPEVARKWAFQKIYHLIGEISRVGESPERIAEIRGLSQRHNIRTSYDE